MPSVSIKNLLEAGVHFGHQTKKWNPKVKKYIFGQRNGIYIIDLQQTLMLFQQACEFAATLGQEGKHILFVGTKRQAQAAIREEAERSSNYFVNQRWLGGLLTNWETVKKSIETLKELDQICDGESAQTLTKKELSRLEKKRAKLTKVFAGIKEMRRPPEALFVIDPKKERIAIHEARRCGIKVISVVDTNCDPDGIDFVIPGNDDAIRAIRLFVSCIADSHMEGAQLSEAKRESEKDAQPEAAAESTAAGEEAAKEPPPKTITLTVPPGGQAPKPSGPSEMEPVPAEGSAKN